MLGLLLWLIPILSSGFILVLGFFEKRFVKPIAFLALLFCLISSLKLLNVEMEATYPWIPVLGLNIGCLLDEWSTTFSFVISLVGILILVYSFKYIKSGEVRYYSLFLLFIGSMLGFVLSGTLLQLFICWELMGVCSYLLIGFHYSRTKAVNAGLKAILTTKIGDICLLLAILLIFISTGSFDLSSLSHQLRFKEVISLFLIVAVLTKSAQFPFYFWLVDAMEGPTTISALLHSATMVASGVFLLLRFSFLITPFGMLLLFVCSAISLLLGGTLALTNHDVKKILAFSTISQLAFMLIAIYSGNYMAGFAHMINHAFFKSLLFLCIGIFIQYVGSRELERMRFPLKYTPILSFSFLSGISALIGVPPFNGFWSKELIMSTKNLPVLSILLIGTFLTILYSFRLSFKIFSGKKKIRESFGLMQVSIMTLSLICLISGFIEMKFIEIELDVLLPSLSIITVGFIISQLYFSERIRWFHGHSLHELLKNELYLNKFFERINTFLEKLSTFESFDRAISRSGFMLSKSIYNILELDLERIEEKTLNRFFKGIYRTLRHLQTSYLNYNILTLIVGIIILFILVLVV